MRARAGWPLVDWLGGPPVNLYLTILYIYERDHMSRVLECYAMQARVPSQLAALHYRKLVRDDGGIYKSYLPCAIGMPVLQEYGTMKLPRNYRETTVNFS